MPSGFNLAAQAHVARQRLYRPPINIQPSHGCLALYLQTHPGSAHTLQSPLPLLSPLSFLGAQTQSRLRAKGGLHRCDPFTALPRPPTVLTTPVQYQGSDWRFMISSNSCLLPQGLVPSWATWGFTVC